MARFSGCPVMCAKTSGGSSPKSVSNEEDEEEGCCDVISVVGTAAVAVLAANALEYEAPPRAS
jgi:hypothetical protein